MRQALAALLLAGLGGLAAAQEGPEIKALMEKTRAASQELSAPIRVKRRKTLLAVRLPTWEAAAAREGGAFASKGVRLSDPDLAEARSVFADAVDLDAVRLVNTEADLLGAPQTWGNVIRVPVGVGMGRAALIHELTHVWQFQTGGTDYISDSVLHNAWSYVTTGRRGKAYKYKLVAGQSFLDYTAEQQAEIVEHYYARKSCREKPAYQRLIAELRGHKAPRDAAGAALREKDMGLPPRGRPLLPPTGWEEPRVEGGSIPQLELRFDTPW